MFDVKSLKDSLSPAGLAAPFAKLANGDESSLIGSGYERHLRSAAPVRTHQFADPPSLCAWLKRHAHADLAEVLVGSTSVAALTDGRAIDADRVEAVLLPHPRFERWAASLGKQITQKAFAQMLGIAEEDIFGGNGTKMKAEVAKASWSGKSETSQEIDGRGFVSMRAKSGTIVINCEFPPFLTIKVPRFIGVEVGGVEPLYEVAVYVEIAAYDSGVCFTLTMPESAIIDLGARRDVVRCVQEQLGEGWVVGIGEARRETVVVDAMSTAPRARLTNADDHRA